MGGSAFCLSKEYTLLWIFFIIVLWFRRCWQHYQQQKYDDDDDDAHGSRSNIHNHNHNDDDDDDDDINNIIIILTVNKINNHNQINRSARSLPARIILSYKYFLPSFLYGAIYFIVSIIINNNVVL